MIFAPSPHDPCGTPLYPDPQEDDDEDDLTDEERAELEAMAEDREIWRHECEQ